MKPLKRPEIKLPKAKVPGFLADLFGDLRDRHLLPLVGLLLVAIVVVPFALRSSEESSSDGTEGGAAEAIAAGSSGGGPRGTTFANSINGLRDYRRRLRHLSARDPFKQQYADPAPGSEAAAAAPSTAAPDTSIGSSSVGAASPSATSPAPSGGTSGGGGREGGSTVEVETRYASYEIDVRIVGAGSAGAASAAGSASAKGGVRVRRGLPELTKLPDRKHPAAIFMGVSPDAKKALLLVSSDVRAVFGDARCLVGSRSCQLLALEPGLPETFVYGARGKTYRIELLKIHRVITSRPHQASLAG